jgi:RNA polymerase sigma-70 factor (ECF subfamily)
VEHKQRSELQRYLTRLADGDREAFRPVFDLAWPRAREVAQRLLQAADAEDAAQAALLKLFQRASEFDPRRDALAWIVGIVTYECMTIRRKAARRREMPGKDLATVVDGTANPEDRTVTADLEQVALGVLGDLRVEDRETVRAAIFGECDRRVRPATFRKRLERALVRLRAAWRDHEIG